VPKSSSTLVATCLLAAALLGAALVDVPSVTLGLKGDEATYVSMALSLTGDRDLKFTQTDLKRFIGLYRMGPEGIFLKQGRRPPAEGLEFGKALLHPLVAAPFVAVFGLNGFLILNILLIAGIAWLAIRYASAQGGSGATIFGLAFVFASITPIYAVWLTPEILNVGLVFTAYFLWLFKQAPLAQERTRPALRWMLSPWTDLAAACLLGAATYSKPPNALLVAPIALDTLRRWRIKQTATVSMAFLGGCLGLFGLTALVTIVGRSTARFRSPIRTCRSRASATRWRPTIPTPTTCSRRRSCGQCCAGTSSISCSGVTPDSCRISSRASLPSWRGFGIPRVATRDGFSSR
jgi:hypothetical protein